MQSGAAATNPEPVRVSTRPIRRSQSACVGAPSLSADDLPGPLTGMTAPERRAAMEYAVRYGPTAEPEVSVHAASELPSGYRQ